MSRAWISKSIGGLAQQVSTFTKEVILTEGGGVREGGLDGLPYIQGSQNEVLLLQKERDELSQRAEAAELQISSMSTEYRKLLDAKAMEIAELKKAVQDLREQRDRDSANRSIVLDRTAERGEAQPDDVDSEQDAQVAQLTALLAKAQTECRQWRDIAESAAASTEQTGGAADRLAATIQELKEQHRDELAALQAAQARTVADLRRRIEELEAGREETDREEEIAPPMLPSGPSAAPVDSAAEILAALQPIGALVDVSVPETAKDGDVLRTVHDLSARLAARLSAETLHMECDLKMAAAQQTIGELQAAMAATRADSDARVKAEAAAKEELQRQVDGAQAALQTLRARMMVDAQDHAVIEGELELTRAREATLRSTIAAMEGKLSTADESLRQTQTMTAEAASQLSLERDRAIQQLENLRTHLVQQEAAATEDAMRRDKQITFLQQQLREARGERDAIGGGLQAQLTGAMAQMDALRADITRLTAERNAARAEAAARQTEIARLMQASANLEGVLAAFEAEREAVLEGMRADMTAAQLESRAVQQELQDKLAHAESVNATQAGELKELGRVRAELNVARGMQAAATTQAQTLQAQLNDAHARLHAVMRTSEENQIDRRLVANTLVQYMTAQAPRRDDVLQLLANMLGLGPAEQAKIGLHKRSFLQALFTPPPPAAAQATPSAAFSEEFVNFLMHEAQGPPPAPAAELFPDSTPVAAIRPAKPVPVPAPASAASAPATPARQAGPEVRPAAAVGLILPLDAVITGARQDGGHT
eukprot:m.61393 g.61393  ORF g.61393 m.61393 type:complete len:772 (+) comp7074_c0_seq1:53-2368(+)